MLDLLIDCRESLGHHSKLVLFQWDFENNNLEEEEENEEIENEQKDSTDNVINNSKKIMDKFLYNLTKNDNDKAYP